MQAMNQLGWLYKLQGQDDKAEPLLVKSLALSEEILGSNHFFTMFAIDRLAELYRTQGKKEALAELLNETLMGADDNAKTTIGLITRMHENHGQPEAAAKWKARL